MNCEDFESFFESGAEPGDGDKQRLQEHLKECKTCRSKFSPFSELVAPSIPEKRTSPRTLLEKDGFWIFFAPTVVGLIGLSIFLILVR